MNQNSYQCFAVGGAVRNILSGKDPLDWDFTTDAIPEKILEFFPEGFYDNAFGTVGIQVEHLADQFKLSVSKDFAKQVIEITTFRTEGKYEDYRRPKKIEWGKNRRRRFKT